MSSPEQSVVSGKRVLLCDDDPDFILPLKLQLEAVGATVLEAASRKDAEELIKTEKPDLAVVDLMMEQEDSGFMLCYSLKKKYPDVPVIMVTAVASETGIEFDAATEEERAWIKADAILDKPVRFEQVEAEMERLLRE